MGWLGTRWRAAAVALLFLGALAALLFSSVSAFLLPRRELGAREQLRTACAALAEEAQAVVASLPPASDAPLPAADNARLAAVAAQVLARTPGVEGGFYLGGGRDQFAGFAHPTGPAPPPGRRDPPPLETRWIRDLSGRALEMPPGSPPLVETRDVGPSRVVAAACPVGGPDHSPAAVWAMIRLTGPEQQLAEMKRYRLAAALALGGVALALALTADLGLSLRRERGRREKLRDELRRAEHLASLGKLLAGVAHEVRNPLAAIRSTVQLWERLPDQARTPESLRAIVRAVDRLNELVSRLLYFARANCDEWRPTDLNALVRESLELVRARADEQTVRIEAGLADGLPAVNGAPDALRQVVLNLLTNALQAMPAGGVLRCETRRDGRAVELRVADTGPGVPPEARPRLCEPFVTTRPEGTGLGLALCREIVEQHGGRVGLEESAGPGASFLVTLPAAGVNAEP